jgi:hypothetical protein
VLQLAANSEVRSPDQSLYPQKPIYNVGQTLILRTTIDVERFTAALERIVAENDAFRDRVIERHVPSGVKEGQSPKRTKRPATGA